MIIFRKFDKKMKLKIAQKLKVNDGTERYHSCG